LRRPAVFAVPRFALRAIYGEFADEGLLASQRAIPAKALQAGFSFQDEEIDATLERLLRA
jgi:NAD dependent epimerase/dehydratase family enzyme